MSPINQTQPFLKEDCDSMSSGSPSESSVIKLIVQNAIPPVIAEPVNRKNIPLDARYYSEDPRSECKYAWRVMQGIAQGSLQGLNNTATQSTLAQLAQKYCF